MLELEDLKMIDTVYFIVCFIMLCFSCMFMGWIIGYDDAKKKYKSMGKGNRDEYVNS